MDYPMLWVSGCPVTKEYIRADTVVWLNDHKLCQQLHKPPVIFTLLHGPCLGLLRLIELSGVVLSCSHFLAKQFSRNFHPNTRKTRAYDCSRQLFIQCHGSENVSIV